MTWDFASLFQYISHNCVNLTHSVSICQIVDRQLSHINNTSLAGYNLLPIRPCLLLQASLQLIVYCMPFPFWYSRIRKICEMVYESIKFQKSTSVFQIHNKKNSSHLAGYINESTDIRFSEYWLDFCFSRSGKWSRVQGVASFLPSLLLSIFIHLWCDVQQHFLPAPRNTPHSYAR